MSGTQAASRLALKFSELLASSETCAVANALVGPPLLVRRVCLAAAALGQGVLGLLAIKVEGTRTITDMEEDKAPLETDSNIQGATKTTTGIHREGTLKATTIGRLAIKIMPCPNRSQHIKTSELPVGLTSLEEPHQPARGRPSPKLSRRRPTDTPLPPRLTGQPRTAIFRRLPENLQI
ncbi:hypothetical protein J7T55_010537 [Diaporthe amygdali]|uniref:uncharacterized protein n=1 Tax=Phomopsis amygdali TaxID=1214568 RepID=UPI0022FF1631|nr:uncharacterized protein J7T55_010537 [Diaporthe amygdali]KAJ0115714.1 hypothetical protein J7T55_010537 [Diaporthe amygdali]